MGGMLMSATWMQTLAGAAAQDPFLPAATVLFLGAVAHALCAPIFARAAHRREAKRADFRSAVLHLLGEVEAVFGLWSFLMFLLAVCWPGKGWAFAVAYLESGDYAAAVAGHAYTGSFKYLEPLFVFIVMVMASTRPIVETAQRIMNAVAGWFGGSPAARWFVVLTLAPLAGSLITEPAAMTIAAFLLSAQFYCLKPSSGLRYATLALLFVNVSIGGALTHFAAPPVVMVATRWGWGTAEVFRQFGWAALTAILVSNLAYFLWFRRELLALRPADSSADSSAEPTVPLWVTAVHVALIAWTVVMLSGHHAFLMVAGFLLFLAFSVATPRWQSPLRLRAPLMVGFFLAGLVVLGGLQGWWIGPVILQMGETALLWACVGLTAFNDNAAITYLAAQVPALAEPGAAALRHAVLAGALAGGGLTVIANAPNPAGQAILGEYFEGGVSAGRLFLWALLPTAVAVACFLFIR
ncbi:MAG: hypothetical protein RL636_1687 [Verrucomicrobiota bacterium]|jgi:hypothetical protein